MPDLPRRVGPQRIVPRAVPEVAATGGATGAPGHQLPAWRGAFWRALVALGVLSVTTGSRWLAGVLPRVDDLPRIAESGTSAPGGPSMPGSVASSGGDSASGTAALPAPSKSAPPPHPKVFGWVPVRRATHYRVEFFRGSTKIFEARPVAARLELPQSWRYAGRRYRLVPGRHTWVVRPGFGPPARARYGRQIVGATLNVPAAPDG